MVAETAIDRVRRALDDVGCPVHGTTARCPAHDDNSPSLSVTEGDKGVLLRCFAGCDTSDIVAAIGLTMADLFDAPSDNGTHDQRRTILRTHDYTDPAGQLLFQTVRFDTTVKSERFRQRRPDGNGGWIWKLGDTHKPLYRLPDVLVALAAGQPIVIAEGEKDCDAITAAEGVVATTNPMGAGNWKPEHTAVLAGATVTIVADDDAAGRKRARQLERDLRESGCTITAVLVPIGAKDAAEAIGMGKHLADGFKPLDTQPPDPGPGVSMNGVRPAVIVNGRPLAVITDEVVGYLQAANDPPWLFIRSGAVTSVRTDENDTPITEALSTNQMRERISRRLDSRRINKDGTYSDCPPPLDVVQNVLAQEAWPFPPLQAVVEMPTLRPDGTIHAAAGYDPATRLLHLPGDLIVPPVPDNPDEDDVGQALELIRGELLIDFPFDTSADRANAIGLLLAPLLRPAIRGQIPLALIDATEPGTGKGLLANVCAVIATGRPMAARPLSTSDEEVRKTVMSVLLSAPAVIVLDNVEAAIASPTLAGVLTTDEWVDRVLGRSEDVRVPNRAVWMATGNNLAVGGDIARRCYRIRLNAHCANPDQRTGFRHDDLLGWVQDNRGRLVAALLTLARAWWASGRKAAPKAPALGMFTPWVHATAGILHHAGVPDFLADLAEFRASVDVEGLQWETFISALHEMTSGLPTTSGALANRLSEGGQEIQDTVPGRLLDHLGKPGFARRMGEAFSSREGRRYGHSEWAVVKAGTNRLKVALWSFNALGTESEDDAPRESSGERGVLDF